MDRSWNTILAFAVFILSFASAEPLPEPSEHHLQERTIYGASKDRDITPDGALRPRDTYGALQGIDGITLNPMNCTYPSKMFRQLVNHPGPGLNLSTSRINHEQDSGDSGTFHQQYKIVDDFFKPGGPILFYQGPEDPLGCFEEATPLFWYAKDVGALIVGIEHRFFGPSVPGNLSYADQMDWPTSAMTSLTLENVLMDSIELVKWIRSSVTGAANSKVIAFGGSYGGFLVTLLRQHFPEIFFGAFPSSSPFMGIVSDPQDPLVYAMGDWNSQVVQDASANASAKIKHAFQDLRQRLASGKFDGLKEGLNLCTQPNSSSDAKFLLGAVAGAYNNLIQYDLSAHGLPLNTMINKTLTTEGDDAIAILNIAVELSNAQNAVDCYTWNIRNARSSTTIPNLYLICTYLPYIDGVYSTDHSIWGSMPPDLSSPRLNDAACQKAFGFNSAESGTDYQRRLLLDQQSLEDSTHIFFTYGTIDPVTSLGLRPWWSQKSRDCSRVYLISGGAHGSDAIIEVPLDSTAVAEARVAQLNTIKEWLGIYDLLEYYPMFKSYNETQYFPSISGEVIGA